MAWEPQMSFVTDRHGRHWLITPKITEEMVAEACGRRMFDLDDPGFCVSCGHEQGGCEPDARGLRCEACGAPMVYGADELAQCML